MNRPAHEKAGGLAPVEAAAFGVGDKIVVVGSTAAGREGASARGLPPRGPSPSSVLYDEQAGALVVGVGYR